MKTTNTIINRTPHEIRILRPGDAASAEPILVLPPAGRGEVARVETTTTNGWTIRLGDDLEVVTLAQRWGLVVGLGAPTPGVYQVVSAIVAAAARGAGRTTSDLLVPGDQVRDDRGRIVGCRGLCEASDAFPSMAIGASVWTTHHAAELLALGVPADLVAAAGGPTRAGMYKIDRSSSEADATELAAWDVMSRLYAAHFGEMPSPRDGSMPRRVERYDVAELAEALLVRPHRRTIASSAD